MGDLIENLWKVPLVRVRNQNATPAPPFALLRVVSQDDDGTFVVDQPENDGEWPLLVNWHVTLPTSTGAANNCGSAFNQFPCAVLYEPSDGEPTVGETWGAAADSWKLARGHNGFIVAGLAANNLVTVWPQLSPWHTEDEQDYIDVVTNVCVTSSTMSGIDYLIGPLTVQKQRIYLGRGTYLGGIQCEDDPDDCCPAVSSSVDTSGEFGTCSCLEFSGGSEKAEGNDANLPSGTANRTVAMWLAIDEVPGSLKYAIALIYGKQSGGTAHEMVTISVGTGFGNAMRIRAGVRQYGDLMTSTSDLSLATWYRVVLTTDGTNEKLYVNGTLHETQALHASFNTVLQNITLGNHNTGNALYEPFKGRVANVIVVANVVWDADDVTQDYENQACELADIPQATITAWIKCDEGTGTTAADELGITDLALSGGAGWSTDGIYQCCDFSLDDTVAIECGGVTYQIPVLLWGTVGQNTGTEQGNAPAGWTGLEFPLYYIAARNRWEWDITLPFNTTGQSGSGCQADGNPWRGWMEITCNDAGVLVAEAGPIDPPIGSVGHDCCGPVFEKFAQDPVSGSPFIAYWPLDWTNGIWPGGVCKNGIIELTITE